MKPTVKKTPAKKTSKKKRPLILISNDDGIEAKGVNVLAKEISKFAEVIVAAPHTQQSGTGHALTVANLLRATEIYRNKKFFGYAIEGTPADCVKLAVKTLLKNRKIDLCISGINHGANTAINIIYSGTVSAATEATILGIPSIAISLGSFTFMDFTPAAKFAAKIAKMVLKKGLPKGTLLNVNLPPVPQNKIKGVLLTKQGKSDWNDYYDVRIDPNKRPYYWLIGDHVLSDKTNDLDHKAINENYISITPIHYDLTDYKMLNELESWNFK